MGEKVEDLDPFRPERLARRILGMGDLEGRVEKVQGVVRPEEAVRLARGQFTLEDFRDQLRRFQSLGPLGELFQMFPRWRKAVPAGELGEKGMKRALAIIDSMTPEERRNPGILNASRRRRIARGSGTSVEEVNRLLRAYEEVQRLVKTMRGKGRRW
jgi:signal recognition particle subunit SRP54